MDLSFLAQTEAAEQGVGILQTIIQGGVPLILAVFCAVEGWVIYKLYLKNGKLEEDYRNSLSSQIGEAASSTRELIETLTKNTDGNKRVEEQLRKNHDTMTRINAELDRREREARGG